MRHYTRDELLELIPSYVIGATSPEEASAVDDALAAETPLAAELRRELAGYGGVVTQLAGVHATTPSPDVRARLLERVRGGVAAGAGDGSPPGAQPTAKPLLVVTGDVPAPATPRQTGRPVTRVPAWMTGALAASLVLATGLGVYSGTLRTSLVDRDRALATALAKLERREDQLNTALEGENYLRVVHVMSADTIKGPGIQFFWNEKQRRGMAHAFRMKPAPAGRDYQIWLLVDGKPVSVKVFNSDPDGHALVQDLTLPESSRGATQVLITEEPAGGSPQPTTQPFMGGTMSK